MAVFDNFLSTTRKCAKYFALGLTLKTSLETTTNGVPKWRNKELSKIKSISQSVFLFCLEKILFDLDIFIQKTFLSQFYQHS